MLIRQATITNAYLWATSGVATADEALEPPYTPAEPLAAYIASSFTASIPRVELTDAKFRFFIVEATELTRGTVRHDTLCGLVPPRRLRPASGIQRIYWLQKATGLGRQLMRYCLSYAPSAGYGIVCSGVWEHNRRALAFYNKMNFERFSRHYFQFSADRQRDLWLQKQL